MSLIIHDGLLATESQKALLAFLKGPGWAFGAFSDPAPDAPRYWYKHFAGVARDGPEPTGADAYDAELDAAAPLVGALWRALKTGLLAGHVLTRCYANGYTYGSEGGLHQDSGAANHFTAIYYPHLAWRPNWAGETLLFNAAGDDIAAAIYPRPNRLAIFPAATPHVARGVARACP